MAPRAVIQGVVVKGLWRTSVNWLFRSQEKFQTPISISSWRCGCGSSSNIITNNIKRFFCSEPPINGNISSSSTSVVSENIGETPQEANLQTISDGSRTEGRVGQTTNMVFGDTVINGSTGEWLTLTQKVDTYPSVRRFTAIGIGGNDFVQSMVLAVESIIEHPVPQEHVKQRVSSGGKYVSVNIGPIQVVSKEQVQAVYSAMRSDERMKFFL